LTSTRPGARPGDGIGGATQEAHTGAVSLAWAFLLRLLVGDNSDARTSTNTDGDTEGQGLVARQYAQGRAATRADNTAAAEVAR